MARFHLHLGGRREFVGKSLGFDLLLGGPGRVRSFRLSSTCGGEG